MHDETLTRLEAMLLSLRDQLDALTERVEGQLVEQGRAISRLHVDVARLSRQAGDQRESTQR